ncbi:MAG: hypothetical protein OCC45_09710 [Desulfotalea sp.]
MISWVEFEKLLLGTIPGVLVLGALGSLLGALILFGGRRLLKWYIKEVALVHVMKIFYPYFRSVIKAKELKTQLLKNKDIANYRLCLNEAMLGTMLSMTITLLLLFSTIFSFLVLWPGQPYALVFLVGSTFYSLHSTILSGMSYYILRPDELDEIQNQISKKYRKFKDYESEMDKKIEAEILLEKKKEIGNHETIDEVL